MPDISKVRPGDPLEISADAYNELANLVNERKNGRGGVRPTGAAYFDSPRIKVKNTSGGALDKYGVVIIDAPVILPADNEDEFKLRVVCKVKTPTDEGQTFVVLLQPLANNDYGDAVVVGAVPCKINLTTAADTHVKTANGTTIPVSDTTGIAEILWVAGGVGTATATGEQWAIIKLGGGAGAELPTPQYQHMVLQAVSQSQLGADWVRAHALL